MMSRHSNQSDSSTNSGTKDNHGQSRKRVYFELICLWLATLLLIRFIIMLKNGFGLPDGVLAFAPLLFIYAPVWLCKFRKVDDGELCPRIPNFRDGKEWFSILKLFFWVNLAIWSWYIPLYHFWTVEFWGKSFVGALPQSLLLTIAYHIFYVAIPEEMFYRGYFQTRLKEFNTKEWNVFGTPIGMNAVVASLFFAFGHSLVSFQWWHFATFFPGMIFAWMRERTNGVMAGALFHAICNIGITILDTLYGVRSPV